jgi:hypothetical protein
MNPADILQARIFNKTTNSRGWCITWPDRDLRDLEKSTNDKANSFRYVPVMFFKDPKLK